MTHIEVEHLYIDSLEATPLVPLRLSPKAPKIWCKLEFLNPSGSTKDRIARYILEKAWRENKIRSGAHVVEASSGSTSIAMALVCAQMGLKFCAVMPSGVSNERVLIIKAYGGEVILSPKEEGMLGAMRLAEEREKAGAFYPRQFENPENARAHQQGTGREILLQMPSRNVDVFVSGVGTGGTIMGLYKAFTEAGCNVQAFVAKPLSPFSFGGLECSSISKKIPGVIEGMSKLYDPSLLPCSAEIGIEDALALETTRKLIRLGFPVGPSSGLNFAAAEKVALSQGSDCDIVTVFPDRMERYFSTELFS